MQLNRVDEAIGEKLGSKFAGVVDEDSDAEDLVFERGEELACDIRGAEAFGFLPEVDAEGWHSVVDQVFGITCRGYAADFEGGFGRMKEVVPQSHGKDCVR